jgi:hypothetical protein
VVRVGVLGVVRWLGRRSLTRIWQYLGNNGGDVGRRFHWANPLDRAGHSAPIGGRERGAALVEAAIALPILLLLLFGIVTTAQAWNVHNTLDHAAREAARAGAVGADMPGTAQGQLAAAGLAAPPVLICARELVGASDGNCLDAVADPTTVKRVQVLVTYPGYQLDFLFFSVTVDMKAPAVARTEPGV